MRCPSCLFVNGEHTQDCRYRYVPYEVAVKSYFESVDDGGETAETWLLKNPFDRELLGV